MINITHTIIQQIYRVGAGVLFVAINMILGARKEEVYELSYIHYTSGGTRCSIRTCLDIVYLSHLN